MGNDSEITHVTTEVFAEMIGVADHAIRKVYYADGHYNGVVPINLPVQRLKWPVADIARLLARRGGV